MNNSKSLTRTIALFVAMTLVGSAVFGAGLAFFLIRMSAQDSQ